MVAMLVELVKCELADLSARSWLPCPDCLVNRSVHMMSVSISTESIGNILQSLHGQLLGGLCITKISYSRLWGLRMPMQSFVLRRDRSERIWGCFVPVELCLE